MPLTNDQWIVVAIAIGVVAAVGIWAIFALLGYALSTSGPRPNGEQGTPRWLQLIKDEPLRVRAAAVTVIGALATLLASIGIDLDPAVQAGIIGVIGAVAIALSELSRPSVTPVKKLEREGYRYDEATGRWRDADGRFTSPPA